MTATNIYDDDEEMKYEHIDKEEYKPDQSIDNNVLKDKREYLIDLCHSVCDILSDENEIKDYINDTLLWLYIKQSITEKEYDERINNINNMCNTIDENVTLTKKDTLAQLCYFIKGNMVEDASMYDTDSINNLLLLLDDTLDWILDIEVHNKNYTDESMSSKIDEINQLCNSIYDESIQKN